MTTSSTNNSVFRGFFEKQKLTGPNFIDWYRQLRIVLSIDDKLNYLEQPLPPAPVAPAGQQVAPEILAAHTPWVKGKKEIVGLMLMTMELEIQRNLENLHANDMLKELKALFAQQAKQELLQTTRDFTRPVNKARRAVQVTRTFWKMKGYIDNLERLGHPVTLGLAMSLILIGLRKEFDGFVQNYNIHSLGKTNKVLVARNAEFLENSLITQEASGILKDLEKLFKKKDTHPSIDTALNPMKRKSFRNRMNTKLYHSIRHVHEDRRPTDRMCLYIDAEEHELGDARWKPSNYKAALVRP
ncbi:hypothetical protein Tco_0477571 [Tanacetum coccineum]